MVKNLSANAGNTRDPGSIPGSGISPRGRDGNHSSILAWEIPMGRGAWQTQTMDSQKSGT